MYGLDSHESYTLDVLVLTWLNTQNSPRDQLVELWVDQGVRLNAGHEGNWLAQSAFSGILGLAVLGRAKEQSTVNNTFEWY